MKVARGQIVLVDFPFAGGGRSKIRPALVVQNDRDNQRLLNTIVAVISSRVNRAKSEPTQVIIELNTTVGRQIGLRVGSVVKCVNLFTLEQSKLLRVLGTCTPDLVAKVNAALRTAFSID